MLLHEMTKKYTAYHTKRKKKIKDSNKVNLYCNKKSNRKNLYMFERRCTKGISTVSQGKRVKSGRGGGPVARLAKNGDD